MRTLLAIIAAFPLAASAQLVRSGGGGVTADPLTLTSSVTAYRLEGTAPSGQNALAVTTNGARVDFGAGSSDYASSDGVSVTFAGGVVAPTFTASTALASNGSVRITTATALDTCAAGHEGRLRWLTGTGGTNSGSMTKLCLCQSDGAASPTFAWQRLNDPSLTLANSIGNTTTCP